MLVQLLQQKNETETDRGKKISVKDIHTDWYPPAPNEVINVLANGHPGKGRETSIIVIDDPHKIAESQRDKQFQQILGQLKDLAQCGFVLICGASAVSGLIDRLGSRRAIRLEYSSLKLN